MRIFAHHLLFRLLFCISIFALFFYSYIDKQNVITKLQIEIPKLAGEVRTLQEGNAALALEVEKMENPRCLMIKLREPQFSHLRPPSQVIEVEEE